MISAIIPTLNCERDLQRLLTSLVPAAVEGLVREVLAADAGSSDATRAICEDAGAEVVEGGVLAAAARAKSERLLILPVGLQLRAGWERALADHLQAGGGRAVIEGFDAPRGWLGRLRAVEAGVLVEAGALAGLTETRDAAALRRRFGRGARRIR